MANDLHAHTMDIRNWISISEAEELCNRFHVKIADDVIITNMKIAGINQVKLSKKKSIINGKVKYRYDAELQINIGRLLKKSNVSMTVLNHKTVNDCIYKLDSILKKEFGFYSNHSNSGDWHISRLDCGMDLELCTDNPTVLREYIKLLHDSFDVNNYRNISYSNYKTNKSFDDIKYESITLSAPNEATGEQYYKYNLYYKLQQLLEVSSLTPEEIKEVAKVIRIEKQIYRYEKVTRGSNKLSSLLDESITEKLMESIVNDMKLLFGTADYLTEEIAQCRIFGSNYSNKMKDEMSYMYSMIRSMGYAHYCDMEIKILEKQAAPPLEIENKKKELKGIRKNLEVLGISVASTDIPDASMNINNLIEQQCIKTKKPRKKAKFATIREVIEKSGKTRYKCNPSLHNYDGFMRNRTCIASSTGGTREECEYKVLLKIKDVLKDNLRIVGNDTRAKVDCIEYCIHDLEAFKTVVDSKNVIKAIDNGIGQLQEQLFKMCPDEYSPIVPNDLIDNALINAE